MKTHLTPDQVYSLNEKHGWFQSGDAQSDVSKAFAQEAIDKYLAMQEAAPEMLEILKAMLDTDDQTEMDTLFVRARRLIELL